MTLPKRRIVYVVSNIDRALAFEWVAEFLDRQEFELSFILLNSGDSELERCLRRLDVPVRRITYRGKRDAPRAFLQLFLSFLVARPHVVHCHLFDAHVIGIPAAWLARIRSRIYTRHNANFHRKYYPWAVKFDAMVNLLSTKIVAPSKNVKRVLVGEEGVPDRKIELIRHGFALDRFAEAPRTEIEELRMRHGTKGKYPVIGVVARYLELKGIQHVIPAWRRLFADFPDAHLVLANASGPYGEDVRRLLADIPESTYTEIPFEPNIYALYHLFDVYVHAPIDGEIEGFGQTYVEALACGIPSVFTMSGVAPEFISDQRNALVVPFGDSDAIYHSMKRILSDTALRKTLIATGRVDVEEFAIEGMVNRLETLYRC